MITDKYFTPRKARIEIIPMIDIMFFLLVFFMMITLHMIPSQGITSNLPKSSTAQTLSKPNVIVDVNAKGVIEIKNTAMNSHQLETYLRQEPHPAQTIVTIAGAGSTKLQNVIDVMDACRTVGISHIGIATHSVALSSQGAHQ